MFSNVKMLEQSRILASNSYKSRCNLWVASRVIDSKTGNAGSEWYDGT